MQGNLEGFRIFINAVTNGLDVNAGFNFTGRNCDFLVRSLLEKSSQNFGGRPWNTLGRIVDGGDREVNITIAF